MHDSGDMREYGGYLPLELPSYGEYHQGDGHLTVRRLNSGRSAIRFAVEELGSRRVWCPSYYCPSVREALARWGFDVCEYRVGFDLEPIIDGEGPRADDAVVLVNYFGIMSSCVERLQGAFGRVVVDNCLGFYATPIDRAGLVSVYSCRKFFGVPDGAYCIGRDLSEPHVEQDLSASRIGHLVQQIEGGTNSGYAESRRNELALGEGYRGMSRLTRRILESVDYEAVRRRREDNFGLMASELGDLQRLPVGLDAHTPWCLPLYSGRDLRQRLVEKRVYVPRMWDPWIGTGGGASPEWEYSNHLCAIPIDQRYSADDMRRLAAIVRETYKEVSDDVL